MLTTGFLIAAILTVVAASLFLVRQYNKSNQRRYNERLEDFARYLQELGE